jgi:hypothetical protein
VKLSVLEFTVPKKGNGVEENDDAFAVSGHRFAIADGATETSFSDRWARSLVEKFTADPPHPFAPSGCSFAEWLEPLQREWLGGVDWNSLPWYAESKARSGAFATFVWLEFSDHKAMGQMPVLPSSPEGKLYWQAMAVGDSCLFQVRGDQLVRAFPLEHAEQFNSRPVLVSSNPSSNERVWENVFPSEGEAEPDDLFFLATDALSHWFLAQHEAEQKPWQTLCAVKTNEDFEELVARLREDYGMRNDDTTLVTICPVLDDFPLDDEGIGQEAHGAAEIVTASTYSAPEDNDQPGEDKEGPKKGSAITEENVPQGVDETTVISNTNTGGNE